MVQDRRDAVAAPGEFLAPHLLGRLVGNAKGDVVHRSTGHQAALAGGVGHNIHDGAGFAVVRGEPVPAVGLAQQPHAEVLGQGFEGGPWIGDGQHRGVLSSDGVLCGHGGGVPGVARVAQRGGDEVDLQAVRIAEGQPLLLGRSAGDA